MLVSFVLVKTLSASYKDSSQREFTDLAVIIAFSLFILLFVCFSVACVAFLLRKTYISVVLVVVFMVGDGDGRWAVPVITQSLPRWAKPCVC